MVERLLVEQKDVSSTLIYHPNSTKLVLVRFDVGSCQKEEVNGTYCSYGEIGKHNGFKHRKLSVRV